MTQISEIGSVHGFDLQERDPIDKNEHVKVWFEDSFAEPDGTHSINGVWSCSYKTFECSKRCCYIFMTILCGGPCALLWGLLFAMQSCYHIWWNDHTQSNMSEMQEDNLKQYGLQAQFQGDACYDTMKCDITTRCVGPCMKSYFMEMTCHKNCWRAMVQCCCDPIHDSIARIFGGIKFHHRYEVV